MGQAAWDSNGSICGFKKFICIPKIVATKGRWVGRTRMANPFSKACKALGIEVIKAYSPQAKGRVERSHGVYQDRLVKELRLKKIQSIEDANQLLRSGFIDKLNEKFMKEPQSIEDAHIALMPDQNLDDILCWEHTRVVYNDFVIRFENQLLQIDQRCSQQVRPKEEVTLKKHLDGKISVWSKGQKLTYSFVEQREAKAVPEKLGHDVLWRSMISRKNKSKSPWSQFKPGWLKRTQDHLTIP